MRASRTSTGDAGAVEAGACGRTADGAGNAERSTLQLALSGNRSSTTIPYPSASFIPAFINIGLIPDSGGSYFVTRILGPARAFEWLTSGKKLTAPEAHTWGLVSEVVEAGALTARAAEFAAQVAAMPTRGIGMTKRLLDHAEHASLEDQLEREAQLQSAATQTEDFREGVAAFLEKRPPQWKGR